MKKQEKKDINKTDNTSRGISTKGYSPARAKAIPAAPEKPEKKQPLSPRAKKTILASVAGVLLIAIVWLSVYIVFTIHDNNFDYLEYDLTKYVDSYPEQYKNYSLNINIAKPHLKNEDGTGVSDVETEYLGMVATDNCGYVIDNGAMISDGTIAAGDEVYIWYRGYIIDSEGREQEVTSLSNFYQTTANITVASNRLYVGLNQFPLKGLEAGLVGKNTRDYAKFEKITDRTVAEGDVVYISCERYQDGKTKEEGEIGYCVRIDLNDPETAGIWRPILEGKAIGDISDFDVTLDGTLYHYYKTSILFVTNCENGENKPVLTVETYAPYDYTTELLQNETVYFDVYVEKIVNHNPWHKDESVGPYDLSMDWNDEYIE